MVDKRRIGIIGGTFNPYSFRASNDCRGGL